MSDRQPLTEDEMRAELNVAAWAAWKWIRACGIPAAAITVTADLATGRQIAVVMRKEDEGQ